MLIDFTDFLWIKNTGYKYINWVYFFKSYGDIFIIKWEVLFWKKNIEEEKKINSIWLYVLWDFNIEINKKEYKNHILRFYKEWDKIYSKSITKYLNNNKIPIFWRKFIPLMVYKDIVKKVFIPDQLKWYIS
jgi:hypothetical protein